MADEFKKSGDKKSYHSCFSCRNRNALIKGTMPCKRCHSESRWKPMSIKQRDFDRIATKQAETKIENNQSPVKVVLSDEKSE